MKVSVHRPSKYQSVSRLSREERAAGKSARVTTRWRANWVVYLGDGTKLNRKLGGFVTKGHADSYTERLRDAAAGKSRETFSPDGYITERELAPTSSSSEPTVLGIAELYVAEKRQSWSPGRYAISVGRISKFVELTTERPLSLEAKSYLHNTWLRPNAPAKLDEQQADARSELEAGSMTVAQLNEWTVFAPIVERYLSRQVVVGVATKPLKHNSRRLYWAVAKAMFRWAYDKKMIPSNPCTIIDGPRRDLDDEAIDPDTVPTPAEVLALAEAIGQAGTRPQYDALVVVMGFAALRVGEAVALQVGDIEIHDREGTPLVWISVCDSIGRVAKRYADGEAMPVRAPKGHKRGENRRVARKAPLTGRAAERFLDYFDTVETRQASDLLFLGPRGRGIDSGCFRANGFDEAVASVFPPPHRLANMTPHDLRKAAASNWFRSLVDPRLAQEWGGWKSLETMNRIYNKIRPGDAKRNRAFLDVWLDNELD